MPYFKEGFYPHFDVSPDYLHIGSRAAGINGNPGSVSDNYYLVISDAGGCSGGCGGCCDTQKRVAAKMKEYVADRKASNPHSTLLFVLVGGDNFYWNGAKPGRFWSTWWQVYDHELTSVPWFSVLGNHDYGNDDPGTACPNRHSRHVCDENNAYTTACGGPRPYSTHRQGYNANALNADKGGVDGGTRANWHQPDYTYFYTIPELSFELLAMDMNAVDMGGLGGNGFCEHCGAHWVLERCGWSHHEVHINLEMIKDASMKIMWERAQAAESKNYAILNHYPGLKLTHQFKEWLPADKRDQAKAFSFFGHTHNQGCEEASSTGECVEFLTGNGGGCCSGHGAGGFTAIAWDSEMTQVVECFAGDDRCNGWPRRHAMQMEGNVTMEHIKDVCKHTFDDPACQQKN